jgi:hypothetical protein
MGQETDALGVLLNRLEGLSKAATAAKTKENEKKEKEKEKEKKKKCEELTININGITRPHTKKQASTTNSLLKIILEIDGVIFGLSTKQFSNTTSVKSLKQIAASVSEGSSEKHAYFKSVLTKNLTIVVSFKNKGRVRVVTPSGNQNYLCFIYGNVPTIQFQDENGKPVPFKLIGAVTYLVADPESYLSMNGNNVTLTVTGKCQALASKMTLIGRHDIETGCVPVFPVTPKQKATVKAVKRKRQEAYTKNSVGNGCQPAKRQRQHIAFADVTEADAMEAVEKAEHALSVAQITVSILCAYETKAQTAAEKANASTADRDTYVVLIEAKAIVAKIEVEASVSLAKAREILLKAVAVAKVAAAKELATAVLSGV